MWGCQFDKKEYKNLETPFMPGVLRLWETNNLSRLTDMFSNNEIFGFVSCSLQTPDHIIKKYEHLNFPPIIKKDTIHEHMLSDYQKKRVKTCGRSLSVTTVVNGWHAQNILLFTPYLKFLLDLGIELVEVTQVIQYTPSKCFDQFIDTCVQGRIAATGHSKTKADTFKVSLPECHLITSTLNLFVEIRM